MAKSKTIKITIDTGALDLGPVPAGTVVVLECGYLHAKEARVPIGEAFAIEDTETRNRTSIARVAEHVVRSWSFGERDVSAIEAFLIALYEEEPGAALKIMTRLADAKAFGRPKLVDAADLGEDQRPG